MSTFARELLREPLVHFLLIGGVLFLIGSAVDDGSAPGSDRIVVTAGRVEQLAATFARTWQRPPTRAELDGLIADHVREEVFFREALAMGLDRDDEIIRRRLRQKMEFLTEDVSDAVEPTAEELRAYLIEHADRYAIPPALTFTHVYLSPDRRGDALDGDAEALLARLHGSGPGAGYSAGDPSLLPESLESVPPREVARVFGEEFAAAVAALEPGGWRGPVPSGYGLHLVHVSERVDGRPATLDEVAPLVRRDLMSERRRALNDAVFEGFREKYTVTIEMPEADEPDGGGP